MTKPSSTVAILTKGKLFAIIAVDINVTSPGSDLHVIGKFDPREKLEGSHSPQSTARLARENFYNSLATSRENGWTIAHIGQRNRG